MNTGIYSDAYLEYWGEIFTKNRLYQRRGIPFGVFLVSPADYLQIDVEADDDLLPLLEGQQAVAQRQADAMLEDHQALRAEAEVQHLPCRNGARVEPLHHHRFPRTPATNFETRRRRTGGAA